MCAVAEFLGIGYPLAHSRTSGPGPYLTREEWIMPIKSAKAPKRSAKLRSAKKLEPQKPLALQAYVNLAGQKQGDLKGSTTTTPTK